MNNPYKIKIVLATYNGEKFIATQLDSIINQSYTNWELLISDDGSVDNTVLIIKGYCLKDPRIRIVNENLSKQGASQNFGSLIRLALNEAFDFLMFADQDDSWYNDKILISLEAMIAKRNFIVEPKLCYTDFEFADEYLNPLPEQTIKIISTWKEPSFERLLVQNNIYGCTMMLNRKLVEKVCPVPLCAENHDYWIALVAITLGDVVHVKQPLMLYRQHSNNVSGHYTNNSFRKRFNRIFNSWKKLENTLVSSQNQSLELYNRYCNEIIPLRGSLLKEYILLIQKKSLRILIYHRKKRIYRNTFMQNIMLNFILLKMFLLPNKNS
jgi:rhamnosyltransferase